MEDFTITEDFPKNEIEFDKRFSDPNACYEYLFKQKWPNGFVCKKCGNTKYWVSARNLYLCTNCQHNHSLIAGTIMDSSKKPITYWYKAMWWFTTRKTGDAALFARNVKSYPDVLRLMNFSSAARNPEKEAAEPWAKQSSL